MEETGYSSCGCRESDMTDTFTHISSKLFFPKDTLPGNPKDSTCEWKLRGPYRPLQPPVSWFPTPDPPPEASPPWKVELVYLTPLVQTFPSLSP